MSLSTLWQNRQRVDYLLDYDNSSPHLSFCKRHLWLCLGLAADLPPCIDGQIIATCPAIPAAANVSGPQTEHVSAPADCSLSISLSVATANVHTLYAGSEAFHGKFVYLKEQFQTDRLNIVSLQETRSASAAY